MKVNTKIRYGLRTMIEIASSTDSNGMLQKDISKNQNISLKYLDPIISALKLKGLIINTKGKGSGYKLARKAEDITILDIYTSFEQIVVVECINNMGFCNQSINDCKGRNYWSEFRNDFIEILSKKTLAQIVNESKCECSKCGSF